MVAPNPFPAVQDTWGALSIPAQPGYSFTPVAQRMWIAPAQIPYSDPCIAVILDYLATAINEDKIIQAAWQNVAPPDQVVPIRRVFPHNPNDVVFQVSWLPALFLWRESMTSAYAADEWYRVTTKLMGLWVFPLAVQERQRAREPIFNAVCDGIMSTIERGRTPSWVQPNDADPRASYEGSVFYPYAAFESLFLSSARRSKLLIPSTGRDTTDSYPAIELTFEMRENQVRGISRFFVDGGDAATLYDASASTVWAGNTSYTLGALVFPTGGNGYVYSCTTAGMSANTPPVWPTTIGATVQDGSVVWTAAAKMAPNGNVTVSGPLAVSTPKPA